MPFDVVSYVLARRTLRRLEEHRTKTPIDHPDLSITRAKLEYPTEYVSFAHLAVIDKIVGGTHYIWPGLVLTKDQFADKATLALSTQPRDIAMVVARYVDAKNHYYNYLASSLDEHVLKKIVDGSSSIIASESVSLDERGQGLAISASGSALKSMRWDLLSIGVLDPLNLPSPTTTISATDTTFSAGHFGLMPLRERADHGGVAEIATYLMPPMTRLPPAKAIIEVEIVGRGTEEDPICPKLAEDVRDGKDYLSVTWGVFDHKPQHSTMLITITADNPYKQGAIAKQVEHAKARNLKVLKPPKDYREAVEQYRQLRKDFPEWIAGKDNYAYQTLGHEVFNYFQVADTYYGNVIDGFKPKAYRNVPDWEMRRTLNMWIDRLKRVNVLTEERDKHVKKLEKVLKVGW